MSFRPAIFRPSLAKSLFAVSIISLFLSFPYVSLSEPRSPGVTIRNFGQINENYYRGGQPTAEEFTQLKQLGVKTVIDLQKDGKAEEETWVKEAGMNFIKIPLLSTRPATPEQTEYFLKLVNDPANLPVYVHCAGGRHRTGALTAIYRITHDSWSAEKAYEEMDHYGYYSFPNHGSLKKQVFAYYKDYQKALKSQERMVANPSPAQSAPPDSEVPASTPNNQVPITLEAN